MRRTQAGTTLLELVISIAIIGLLTVAVTRAFVAGLSYETNAAASRERALVRDRIEDHLIDLFQHAYLGTNQAETSTYFIATQGGDTSGGGGNGGNADTVTFTIQGQRPSGALVESTDDFETINENYGPQGGVAEIGLSTTPVGDAGSNEGLFERTQRPSDGEPTQGGTEKLLDGDIQTIEFEFWDGTTWTPTWSTQAGATKRLPAAVRVTYTLRNQSDNTNHIFVVRIPASDVTADNPAEQTAAGGAQ